MPNKSNSGLAAYCREQLGKPYWYGTFGQTATQSLLVQKSRQYPSQFTASRVATAKASHLGKRVHDCIGLIKGYLWSADSAAAPVYDSSQDVTATAMEKLCVERGKIADIPEIPGLLVFFTGHVGVYIGGGKVIEARGFSYGVVETSLAERPFKTWGKCPFIKYDDMPTQPSSGRKGEKTVTIKLPQLSQGSSSGSVSTVQRLLKSHSFKGANGRVLSIDGVFGSETAHAVKKYQTAHSLESDGIVGVKTWNALLSE